MRTLPISPTQTDSLRASARRGPRKAAVAGLVFGALLALATTGRGQTARLDPASLASMEFATADKVLVTAIRFAPGPEGTVFLLVDPQDMGEDSRGRDRLNAVDRVYLYAPNHPEWATPQAVTGRTQRGLRYEFRNLRMSAEHEGMRFELVLDGQVRHGGIRRLTLDVEGRYTIQSGPRSSAFLVARDLDLSRFLQRGSFTLHDFTARPSLSLRAMEGGRLAVANLTLGEAGDGRGRQTYLFPMQGADNQIRVDALNEQGHVFESIQLRNRRDQFAERDSWTGQFRRLRAGQSFTLRARIDLGLLGELEDTVEVTVFDI